MLRTVLASNELIAAGGATEVARRRAITISPARGAAAVLEQRAARRLAPAAGAGWPAPASTTAPGRAVGSS